MKLRILEKAESIKNYEKDLKNLSIKNIDSLNSKEKYYASSMIMFSILNDFFVLSDEVIDYFDFEIAQTYREIFEILNKEKIIDEKELKFCKKIVYLRNKLAHEYGNIEKDELFELIEKVDYLQAIIDKMILKIKKEENN